MKPITLPDVFERKWITGVSDEALPSVLVELCLRHAQHRVHVVCFKDSRTLSHSLNEVEALLSLPLPGTPAIDTVELPCLEDYRHLDSVLLDKQCDVVRTLGLIQQCHSRQRPLLIFTTPDALLQELPDTREIAQHQLQLKVGQSIDFESLKQSLADALGYAYEAVCEQPGQFAVRGGLIDVYPVNELTPYRIDFFGDEIEHIKTYDPTTQLTDQSVGELLLLPLTNPISPADTAEATLLTRYLDVPCVWTFRNAAEIESSHDFGFQTSERIQDAHSRKISRCWLDRTHARKDVWYGIDELAEHSALLHCAQPDAELSCTTVKNWLSHQKLEGIHPSEKDAGLRQYEQQSLRQLHQAALSTYQVVVAISKPDEQERYMRMVQDEAEEGVPIRIVAGSIPAGIVFHRQSNAFFPEWLACDHPQAKGVILVSEADLHPYLRIRIGRRNQRRAVEISQVDQMLDFTELSDGDLLVHQQHGICIFRGIHVLDFSSNRESLSLEFAEGSMLHVPLTETHQLTRYIGLTKRNPKLGKLGSNQWEKERKAAERSTVELAAQLLALQAHRDSVEGFAYPPDDEWMKQFEKAFPYTETPDQLTAIHQCKHDMERVRPMDRLICGDVGFGKTEVAMRAAFKALEAGKQVAVLVPTTVLCQQHYHSFRERMAPFPVTLDMVSGFRSPSEQKKTLKRLKTGQVDLVIGTHRLLSKDVAFHDLGLIVIDEEHRFGVKQKERLKQLSTTVDVLTLSATPIPRTLYMALAGARDLSVIETPPRNRLPIETLVRNYSDEIVDAAIRTEIARGGQVFYLHNRVQTIDRVATAIQARNPSLRVVVGHGQMDRQDLERIMTEFVDGAFDVMVCTTIIESGLDIPNCNTLIIEGADKFGLAQIYQIRGRVGRFNRQAYAYLLLHGRKPVASVARKRLSAIQQYNELGAGYRIAMRDLELRGAGNILGAAQSGHIAGVGFELYCRLLKQSIARFRDGSGAALVRATVNLDFARYGEPSPTQAVTTKEVRSNYAILKDSESESWVDPIYAYIPAPYIHETKLRIETYRKLASAASLDEVKQIRAAMIDRFGKIPDETEALIRISAIRCLAEQKNIASVECNKGRLMLRIAHTRTPEYHKTGTHFPRLTKKKPLLLLNDCLSFLSKL